MTKLIRNDDPSALTLEQAREKEIRRRRERQRQADELAAQGRGEDTEIAHVARGELVIPAALQTPELMEVIARAVAAHGVPLEKLRIGSRRNSINPETGMAEFGKDGHPMPEDDPGEPDVTIVGPPLSLEEIEDIQRDVLENPLPKANPILQGARVWLRG